MPSNKNPAQVVHPGSGKLPASTVTASALSFPPGGGGGAALQAHIHNPLDAHMASAIGIHAISPITGLPILSSAGGVVDGESVEDFIYQFKDLIPVRPNGVGYNLPAGINSGVPVWGFLDPVSLGGSAVTGGWAKTTNTIPSHYVVPNGTASFDLHGMVFPADRGVLAFYRNTDGNFFNPATTTLVAALWLGVNPPPAGLPSAAFDETVRPVQQISYTATGVNPLDKIDLTWRLPYLTSYAAHPGVPYAPYTQNFPNYQLAIYALSTQLLSAGDAGSYLIVHWKDTYATTLASIQPANLTALTLVSANCHSATPTAPTDFDDNTLAVFNVNRHMVYRDALSATAPALNTLVTAAAPIAWTTQKLSGVSFVSTPTINFDMTVTVNHLFDNSFDTGSVAAPPNVPSQFQSAFDPIRIDFADFGGGVRGVPYFSLNKQSVPGNYSLTNAPQPADVAEYGGASVQILTPTTAFTPTTVSGFSVLKYDFHKPLSSLLGIPDASKAYLYNTFPAAGGAVGSSTSTYENFVDEHYRYVTTYAPVGSEPTIPPGYPAAGDSFNPATSLVVDTSSLQVIGNCLIYPKDDFSAAAVYPAGNPNYSACSGLRRYLRAVNTGVARNTGKLRLRFLVGGPLAFTANAAYDGTETTGHTTPVTGGMIIQVKVPGVTGWLDLGRSLGDPGLATTDFYGCSTGVLISGSDIIVSFQTTAFTVDNGSGEFPLFVRVSMLAGYTHRLDEMEWMPP